MNPFVLIVVGLLLMAALIVIVIAAIAVWWLRADEALDQLTGLGPVPEDDPDVARDQE
ncbi:hypothetical protein R75461_07422 [Paraburkholderia nemoris]|uniref:hypothetical protein n=1 Tax=Paraburkholderia nemoris TaxID=2793076 RepID=UPI00190A7E1B|nr:MULTISPECIES: hypothetical protein [Paraburkholderia]MBK3786264.1 hypothetical protein [Paraburkholderia aspalathi]CAE6850005.1 hypothetical protein R75461_07422 [Paraburkholderia nemoris]